MLNSLIESYKAALAREQLELCKYIVQQDAFKVNDVKTVAGVDLAYWYEDNIQYAVCCIVVLDRETKQVIESVHLKDKVATFYMPTFLGYREIPLILKTLKLIQGDIDVLFVDGNGYYHPRHMGSAVQLGILTSIPTVGVAKNFYKLEGAVVDGELEVLKGATLDIVHRGEVVGKVVRSRNNTAPIYVSVGNDICLDTALDLVLEFTSKKSKIPLPIWYADIATRKWRKELQLLSKNNIQSF